MVKELERPKKIAWEKDTLSPIYGKFIAEPLERGYGITLGNALRRILLSSLPGTAVASVKIEGVMHEFSTIPGIMEDVLNIILNLKNLLVKLNASSSRTIYLKVQGEKEVKAKDIAADAQVKILNPDLHIATLTQKDALLDLKMVVEQGRGYLPREMNKRENAAIGEIAMDCLFSPVRRVSYTTEETRVGALTNYDRLIMEIWTDGRIAPQEALIAGAKILRHHATDFISVQKIKEDVQEKAVLTDAEKMQKEILDHSIEELEFSIRVSKVLPAMRVRTIGELTKKREGDFLKRKNFGKKSLQEIKEKLQKWNLHLAPEKEKK